MMTATGFSTMDKWRRNRAEISIEINCCIVTSRRDPNLSKVKFARGTRRIIMANRSTKPVSKASLRNVANKRSGPREPQTKIARNSRESPTWLAAFRARTDLASYGDNALGLFALAIRFRIEDLESVAANSITDGSDDKKCDIVYVDKDNGIAVVAQCYMATSPKDAAPSNKASDLNTALSWILQRPLNELPERIRSSAEELRATLKKGQITELNLWYIYNLDQR